MLWLEAHEVSHTFYPVGIRKASVSTCLS